MWGLQEANLLDNRNPEVWAFLSLLCSKLGPSRAEEADASLQQAIRLGLSNPSLLRELGTAYMALDRLAHAEDLVRRAAAVEAAANTVTGKAAAFTRKLLADVLAGQNQVSEDRAYIPLLVVPLLLLLYHYVVDVVPTPSNTCTPSPSPYYTLPLRPRRR